MRPEDLRYFLVGLARRHGLSFDDAEDVVQSVIIETYQSAYDESKGTLISYMKRRLAWRLASWKRKEGRFVVTLRLDEASYDPWPDVDDGLTE